MFTAIKDAIEGLFELNHGRRILVILGIVSGMFAIGVLTSELFSFYVEGLMGVDITSTAIPALLLSLSGFVFALLYLQSGGVNEKPQINKEMYYKLRKEALENSKRLSVAENLIIEFKNQLEASEPELSLTNEEKHTIIENVVLQSSEEAIKKIFTNETGKLRDSIEQSLSLDRLIQPFNEIVNRLHREIRDLRLRSNINLAIGMIITAGGLYLLWSTVDIVDASELLRQLASEGSESDGKFVKNLVLPLAPRILLVIFVEIFAYFFLRLYKDGLSEIKYFQNELTNIEAKLVSVEFAYVSNQTDSLKLSLDELSRTERNFILEKDQTTVELEKAKYDSELARNVINTIPDLFKKTNK